MIHYKKILVLIYTIFIDSIAVKNIKKDEPLSFDHKPNKKKKNVKNKKILVTGGTGSFDQSSLKVHEEI